MWETVRGKWPKEDENGGFLAGNSALYWKKRGRRPIFAKFPPRNARIRRIKAAVDGRVAKEADYFMKMLWNGPNLPLPRPKGFEDPFRSPILLQQDCWTPPRTSSSPKPICPKRIPILRFLSPFDVFANKTCPKSSSADSLAPLVLKLTQKLSVFWGSRRFFTFQTLPFPWICLQKMFLENKVQIYLLGPEIS